VSQDDPIATLFWNTRTDAPESVHARARELATNYLGERVGLPLAPGDTAGAYEIVRVLGAGGQAVVYEAVHRDLGRHVALKVPRKDTGDRLVREAKLMASLEHPAIVQVLDLSLEGPVPYLVLELCEKGSLDDRLEIVHPDGLPLDQVRRASVSILEALAHAHKTGVVHRDVKPANVLFDKDHNAKVADFGIGTVARADELSVSHDLSQLSLFAGTPLYLAPEQENPALRVDGKLDGRADLFAFGKLLFQMLTGASPRTIRPPSRLRPGLDPAWDEYVFKLTEERPERRYDSAEEALRELPRFQEGRRRTERRASNTPPPGGGATAAENVLFGKIALNMGLVDRTLLEQALAYQKASAPTTPLSELLFQRGLLTREQVAQILERQRQVKAALAGTDPLVGTCIGGCTILAKLADGGMGAVYRARHEALQKDVVIKVLAAEPAANSRTVERFKREALLAAQLEHPNIVGVLNVGTTDGGLHYMVMDYVEGRTLEATLGESGPFPVENALRIALDVARALSAAHRAGIVHRDIRPDNIFVTADGVVKVGDFGLARDLNSDLKLTSDGAMIGTPLYMAPEIGRVRDVDGRIDIYSLGLVFYYLVTGVQPFRSFSAIEILSARAHERIVPPSTYLVQLPDPVLRVLGKMLEKNRDQRYRDADALIRDLVAASDGRPVEAGAPTLWRGVGTGPRSIARRFRQSVATPPSKRAKRILTAILAVLLLGGLALGIAIGRDILSNPAAAYDEYVRKLRGDERWLREARERDADIRHHIDDWIRRGKPKE
jgi:serine/threonine protein kinase